MAAMASNGMTRLLFTLRLVFLALFAVGAAATWGYQIYVVQPAKHCEEAHRWWDPKGRVCATPVSITTFTRRPIGAAPQP